MVLQGREDYGLAYLEDIFVFSDTLNNHLKHIQKVLTSSRRHKLKSKTGKCEFFKNKLNIQNLGLAEEGYYKIFIPGFSSNLIHQTRK